MKAAHTLEKQKTRELPPPHTHTRSQERHPPSLRACVSLLLCTHRHPMERAPTAALAATGATTLVMGGCAAFAASPAMGRFRTATRMVDQVRERRGGVRRR